MVFRSRNKTVILIKRTMLYHIMRFSRYSFYIVRNSTSHGGWTGVCRDVTFARTRCNMGGIYLSGEQNMTHDTDCSSRIPPSVPFGRLRATTYLSKRKWEKYADWTRDWDNRCEITFRVARGPRKKDKKEDIARKWSLALFLSPSLCFFLNFFFYFLYLYFSPSYPRFTLFSFKVM